MEPMEEDTVERLLALWGLPQEIIKTFKDNEITADQLPYLDNSLLKELIPQMGPRLTVLQEIQKLKEKNDPLNHCTSSATTMTEVSELNQSLDQSFDTDISESSHQQPNLQVTSETPIIICADNEDLLSFLKPRYEDFDLKTLLLTSPLGKSILNYYKTNNKLDNTRRNRLVSIIVKHLYNHIVKNRLQQDEYNSLAAKIVVLFPTEPMGVYYCPPVKKSCSPFHKPVMAKGKLVNHCRNILFRSGDTNKQRKRKHEDDEDSSSFGIVPKQRKDNLEETFKEEIAWLQHNTEPWKKVMEYWTQTWEVRSTVDVSSSVSEFLERWPILNDLRASVLINLDFEKKFPTSHVAFHLNWESFFQKVVSYKGNEVTDATALSLLKTLRTLKDEDEKLPLQLTILSYLFPPSGRIRTKCGYWKFSILESIEGMFLHVKNPGDIDKCIQEKIEKAFQKKQTVQPYLLIDGDNLETVKTAYIVIDRLKYQFISVTEAFDVLFKCYHVMNINYAPQSQHLWQLIQICVYKIRTKFDKVFPNLLDILAQFN